MNKVGFLAAVLTVPFLVFRFLPMGHARLPLDLFDSSDALVAIFGISIGVHAGIHVVPWWFVTTEVTMVLAGVVFWFFPLLSCLLCLGGVNKAPDRGRKLYLTAFVMQFAAVALLFVDGLLLGRVILPRVFPLLEFVAALQTGFWIYGFTMLLTLLAATTYKET